MLVKGNIIESYEILFKNIEKKAKISLEV
ncbi:hypothetical protein HMPREF9712_03561, partial [Myroides odoratimimus CCUG 10230]